MENNYGETIKFWENIFSEEKEYNPEKQIGVEALERGIQWVACDSEAVIDFGCGNGVMLLRCISEGAERVYGIDLSNNAIALGQKVIDNYKLQDRASLICGSVEKIKELESNSFSGAILSNIIDNLIPEDSKQVLEEIHRVLEPNGKLLLKFNPYLEKELREEYELKEISEEFYKETTGLYLWNLKEEKIKELIAPYFAIEKYEIVEFKEYDQINRMYYLRAK